MAINVSNEYKEYIKNQRRFHGKAQITLANGTILNLTDEDFMSGGIAIEDATSGTSSFDIGSVIINQLTLKLNNTEDKFSLYDFNGASILPYVGLELSNTIEWLHKGIFEVYEPNSSNGIINIIAFDNMKKLDKPFSLCTIDFPCTVFALLQQCCLDCEVPLLSSSFTNASLVITNRPTSEAITYREIVSHIAQLSGCYARCDIYGRLELKWYDTGAFEQEDNVDGGTFDIATESSYKSGDNKDGGNFTNYSSGDSVDGGTFLNQGQYHHLYDIMTTPTIATDDVVITGLKVSMVDTEGVETSSLYGSAGYVLEIANNPLISREQVTTIANSVGATIVGMKFRPLSISVVGDPSIEAGDCAYVTDRKQNTYQTYITNVRYRIGSNESISCGAESPSSLSSSRFTEATKAIVASRKVAKSEITKYDSAVQQLNDLLAHSFGVYKTEQVQEDGSVIYYMHNKPTLAASMTIWKQTADAFAVSTDGGKTYTAGFDSNGNAVLNVLNAIGINANWINTGTIKGIRGEFDNGRIGKFNITSGGLENDSFKLYDADNRPWLWMHDSVDDKHSTMQTVGFLHSDGNLMAEDNENCLLNSDGMKISVIENNQYVLETSYKKDGIYTDGELNIYAQHGNIMFMEDYVAFSANGGQIQIYDNNIHINSTDDVFVNGRSVNDLFQTIYSMQSDIATIKAKLNIT
ncbi:hypothetical protein [Anaerosporobacter sp.]|uniref:hypothetical protein n=1 Tax=Anaerosporobacter sp. TaxID=1872529 RepID=UPI00286F0304|nr:hypothetical protein [Anaerosporobacter sp.]